MLLIEMIEEIAGGHQTEIMIIVRRREIKI